MLEAVRSDFQRHYKDKTIIIKISWAEISQEEFESTIQAIKALITDKIKIILVFWWWNQITEHWKQSGHRNDRPKTDNWIWITSSVVLKDWVIPAYNGICEILKNHFANMLEGDRKQDAILHPSNSLLVHQLDPDLIFVWKPIQVALDLTKSSNITWFVWKDKNGQEYNVNADDIVEKILEENKWKIAEVIFVTWTRWILDNEKNIIDVLSEGDIDRMCKWEHKDVSINWWMHKKTQVIQRLLKLIDKVALTDATWLYKEITRLEGSWTLCCNLEKSNIDKIKDPRIFEEVYNYYSNIWAWRKMSKEEIKKQIENHYVLNVENSRLWWYSLFEDSLLWNRVLYLENLWAWKFSDEIWLKILEHAKKQAKDKRATLLVHSEDNIFKKSWFTKTSIWNDWKKIIWEFMHQNYDKSHPA